MRTIPFKPVLSILLLWCSFLNADAQRLPNVQQNSLRAPANVKIDARLNEWDGIFRAYNNNTDVFYTMANDDKNLYLVIKSTDQMNTNKIVSGGINFTINTSGKKTEKNAYTVVFPLIEIRSKSQMRTAEMGPPPGGGDNIRIAVGPGGGSPGEKDLAVIAEMRKELISVSKEIRILGFTADIPDLVISVYNEYNIKAAIDYDAKGDLVYEMAIPLKYLHLSTGNPAEFAYNIKLNGLKKMGMIRSDEGASGPPPGAGGDIPIRDTGGPPPGMMQVQGMFVPTDFWGKYILAKP